MMVRKMAYVGFSYMAGLFFASFFALWVSFSLASALAAGAAVWLIILLREKLRDIRALKIILCSFSCAVGIFLYCGYDTLVYGSITAYDGAEVISEAVISEVSSIGNDKCLYIVNGRLNGGIKAKFGFFGENRGLSKGDLLTVRGKMYIPENTAAFSGRDQYKAQGVFLFMKSADIMSCTVNESSLYKYTGRLRNMIMSQIRRLIPSEEGELLIGMLLGSEYHRLEGKTEKLLYRSGIGHVTAVSGMHLAIACGVICSLASAVIRTSRTKFFAAFITAAFFCVMTDFSPTVVRSAVMLLLTCMGGILGRKADSLNSLGIAVILLTAAAPYSVRNTGLLLSLAGAMGTGVMAPYLMKLLAEHRNKKDTFPSLENRQPSALLSSAVSSFSAACAVFPVAVMSFDEVSVISPLVNLLLSPFYSAALAVSVFAVMLLPLKAVSDGLFLTAGILCKPVLGAAKLAGAADFAVIPLGLPPVVPCAVIGGIFTAAVLILTHDGKYTSAAFSLSAAVFTVVISVYRLIPSDSMHIAVLTDSSGCAAVMYGDSSAVIIDMSAEKECALLTEKYLAAMGINHAGLVMLTKESGYTESLYRSFLSETEYISDTEVSDADAVKCSFDGFNIEIISSEGNYTVDITKEDGSSCRAAFLCGEGDISLENADLAVFNRKKGCDASDRECIYLVTNEKYEGVFSASSDHNYCVSSVYSFSGEKLSAVSD